ncbi:MAG: hypothetical protein Q9174_005090 [Haloplaca sp. 1 TL-2023]
MAGSRAVEDAWKRGGVATLIADDQSPVFDAMCRHFFKESTTHQIDLPEDDPEAFNLTLKYLYTGDFAGYNGFVKNDGQDTDRDVRALRLADVFLLADKYQISDLKELVVSKLANLIHVSENLPTFLEVSRTIYTGIPEEETVYRSFFKKAAMGIQKVDEMDGSSYKAFDKAISGGGMLASDLVASMLSQYDKKLEDSERNFEIAMQNHEDHHYRCKRCKVRDPSVYS